MRIKRTFKTLEGMEAYLAKRGWSLINSDGLDRRLYHSLHFPNRRMEVVRIGPYWTTRTYG
jgi:hypothetical protein